ncbi:metallo-beta-lactamase family protein [Oceanospirillum multiglobuliferum]|nr:MBL fold metallo-hydrolase [Oceanospirillum multiglobuliferum]SKA24654.1 metallo-beta-lactamase family protein [Oceanospirillum multiglobuliferum]
MFEIIHHGAVDGVTGSCHQLRLASGDSVLVDCGLFQGVESLDRESGDEDFNLKQIDFSLAGVKALLVTHCHIDHVGRIPYLLAAGFDGPIYATEATAQLLPLVLEDALKVGVSRDGRLIDAVLSRLKSQLVPMAYGQWFRFDVIEGLKAKFQCAGHIFGSAYIEFEILASGSIPKHRVVFSGDLGAPYSPLLPAPKSPYRADTLIIESTYGDRLHESRRDRRRLLQSTIERCFTNGGTVLIPAFSIGRTQELLYELEETIHRVEKRLNRARLHGAVTPTLWEHLDIIVDSPLASKFTECYRTLKSLWDAEARRKVSAGRHPLSFEQLLTIDDHAEHLQTVDYLKRTGRPAIVIAASGMCAGGRIQNYLKALLPDPRTDLLFVGYQAKGTPGRDIQTYGPRGGYVMLDGQRVDIRAGIYTLNGYSAHADQGNLLNFVKRMRYKPQHIRLVHGDVTAKRALQALYQELLPSSEVVLG